MARLLSGRLPFSGRPVGAILRRFGVARSGGRAIDALVLSGSGWPRDTRVRGVRTGAASICYWQADAGGMTLWLDVRNGGGGVELGDRRLEAATIVVRKGRAGEY